MHQKLTTKWTIGNCLANYETYMYFYFIINILPYFKVIAQHCIVRICEMITKNQHLAKFVLHSIMLTEKYLVYLSGVVPVRCMQTTISVTLKQL